MERSSSPGHVYFIERASALPLSQRGHITLLCAISCLNWSLFECPKDPEDFILRRIHHLCIGNAMRIRLLFSWEFFLSFSCLSLALYLPPSFFSFQHRLTYIFLITLSLCISLSFSLSFSSLASSQFVALSSTHIYSRASVRNKGRARPYSHRFPRVGRLRISSTLIHEKLFAFLSLLGKKSILVMLHWELVTDMN